jgi:hypothetical protein
MEATLRCSLSPVNYHRVGRADSSETDPQLRRLAQEIITDQQSEIELM